MKVSETGVLSNESQSAIVRPRSHIKETAGMQFSTAYIAHTDAIVRLFEETFTASEGPDEGQSIGALVRQLLEETPSDDLRVCTAWDADNLLGGLLFTRLSYQGDSRTVFMMAPVAVATAHQGVGIGQQLIRWGLEMLRHEDVEIAVTYGDPAFYGRVGFLPVSETDLPAPQPLSLPQGWIAQSLSGSPITPVRGPVRCVPAFDNPIFW